jgi:hypothetical protein
LVELQAKNEEKTVLDIFEGLASHAPGGFHQKVTIDGDDLRDPDARQE